jgi:hypothetical protein
MPLFAEPAQGPHSSLEKKVEMNKRTTFGAIAFAGASHDQEVCVAINEYTMSQSGKYSDWACRRYR